MKRSHLIILLMVGALVGTLIGTFTSTSRSVNFEQALAEPGVEFKVSGTLHKETPVIYDPELDAGITTFHMADKSGKVVEVHLHKSQPQGLLQSESIDLYGKFVDGEFHASEMLLKCPSKYNENNHVISEAG
jgi:cytochrome c-type biogenesis protein CcmE